MCCSGPMPLPGAVTWGLTCGGSGAGGSGVGVCGGKGRFSLPPHPDLSLPSSLWRFGLLGNIFSEGKVALPDFEPPPSKRRRTLEVPRVNKVRLGRGWEERLPAPACGSCLQRQVPTAGGDLEPLTRPGKNSPSFSGEGCGGPGRAPGPSPSAFPPFPWQAEPQPATPEDQPRPLTRPLAISRGSRRASIFQRGQGGCFFWLAFSLSWT